MGVRLSAALLELTVLHYLSYDALKKSTIEEHLEHLGTLLCLCRSTMHPQGKFLDLFCRSSMISFLGLSEYVAEE